MRLFIAIELDDETKNMLHTAAETLRENSLRGNFTHTENYHLTLVFLGEQDNAAQVRRAMQSVRCTPFQLHIHGSGAFRRTGGDIYWAGVEQNDTLAQLYADLVASLRRNGLRCEDRAYKPHLTLGREVVVKHESLQAIRQISPDSTVKVETITLMRSDRINGKLTYTPIYRQKLK